MQISIIIVNYNVFNDIVICIKSIAKNLSKIDNEIIVVDNKSTDRSIDKITNAFPFVKYVPLDANHGFGYANNAGMRAASGKYFLLVNPDIIFLDDTIEKLYSYLENNNNAGAAGPVQQKPNEGIERYYPFFPSAYSRLAQEFGLYFNAPFMKSRFNNFWDDNIAKAMPFKVDWVMGSCMMVRRDMYNKLGGFDETFFLYEEEVDWQYRMNKNGWYSVILPECRVLHNHHSSAGKLGTVFVHFHEFRSRIIFSNKHDHFIKRVIRKILTSLALILRIVYTFIAGLFSKNELLKSKLASNIYLLKFNLSAKNKILRDRYDFETNKQLFLT